MKVYVVTSGAYSDFGIDSVWSTKEKAVEYISQMGDQKYDGFNEEIDEYEVDSSTEIRQLVEVIMDRGLAYKTVRQYGVTRDNWRWEKAGFSHYTDYDFSEGDVQIKKGCLVWVVQTDSKEQAIKAVAEKATIILANNAWGDDELTKELFSK